MMFLWSFCLSPSWLTSAVFLLGWYFLFLCHQNLNPQCASGGSCHHNDRPLSKKICTHASMSSCLRLDIHAHCSSDRAPSVIRHSEVSWSEKGFSFQLYYIYFKYMLLNTQLQSYFIVESSEVECCSTFCFRALCTVIPIPITIYYWRTVLAVPIPDCKSLWMKAAIKKINVCTLNQ